MLADDHALGRDHHSIRVDPKAHWSIGEGCRDAVAIALQVNQAGRSDPLGVFDKAVERAGCRHQSPHLLGPEISDGALHLPVWRLRPELFASGFQPVVESGQRWKAGRWLPEPVTSILDVLLDLSLLPA